jgi:hypothetical protein
MILLPISGAYYCGYPGSGVRVTDPFGYPACAEGSVCSSPVPGVEVEDSFRLQPVRVMEKINAATHKTHPIFFTGISRLLFRDFFFWCYGKIRAVTPL